MFTRPWDLFFKEKIGRIISEKKNILDIGGGLRIDKRRNNRYEPKNSWIEPLLKERGVSYQVLDYVDTFHPDVVGDVQNLPLEDASQEAIICNAVLEHVENPIKAATELYRVLKAGGYCFLYVPFLYYFHAEEGYYGDFWRFTYDGIHSIFKPFLQIELMPVRGPIETLIHLSPFGRMHFLCNVGFIFDTVFRKLSSKQVAGYYVFLTK